MKTDYDLKILKQFIDENFDIKTLVKVGFIKKEIKKDYLAIANRICVFFGYETIYEYGTNEIRAHLSYDGDRPKHVNEKGELKEEAFITVMPSIYDKLYD